MSPSSRICSEATRPPWASKAVKTTNMVHFLGRCQISNRFETNSLGSCCASLPRMVDIGETRSGAGAGPWAVNHYLDEFDFTGGITLRF